MKKMLAGIFLLILSVWLLVFANATSSTPLSVLSVILPFVAAFMFFVGYFSDDKK